MGALMALRSDTDLDADAIARERERLRGVFRSAYGRFREISSGSHVHVQDPEEMDSTQGGTVRILSESDWCCDFHLLGKRILRGREERIFSLHYMLGLSFRGTMEAVDFDSVHALKDAMEIIEEKVGRELEHRGV